MSSTSNCIIVCITNNHQVRLGIVNFVKTTIGYLTYFHPWASLLLLPVRQDTIRFLHVFLKLSGTGTVIEVGKVAVLLCFRHQEALHTKF